MNYKVLIVEDDPMVAMINSQFVKKSEGFEVAGMCRNGQEALDFLESNTVDLILLDVFMPVLNGTETLKKIRSKKINSEVIMVTAANDTATIEETVHLGVHDYLIKPFTYERFYASLEKFKAKKEILNQNTVMDQSSIDNLILHGNTALQATASDSEDSSEDVQASLPKGIHQAILPTCYRSATYASSQQCASGAPRTKRQSSSAPQCALPYIPLLMPGQ